MSAIGPELPPHLLAKRKRAQEESAEDESLTDSGAKRARSVEPEQAEPRRARRVVGPALPPAPPEERPTEPADGASDSDSDDNDDFGPALPPSEGQENTKRASDDENDGLALHSVTPAQNEAKAQRDAWMTMAPTQDNLASQMDPARQRARGFRAGKSARAPESQRSDASMWHETMEQKQKRLADEMMGVTSKASAPSMRTNASVRSGDDGDSRVNAEIRRNVVGFETDDKLMDTTADAAQEKSRGPSLVERHQQRRNADGRGKNNDDDDPSKRTFDREKDMAVGMRVSRAERGEMLKKAGDFSSRFSGGNYL